MKNRISRLFSPETGNTVMLAFDHGYIMGSTAGLERLDVSHRASVRVCGRAHGYARGDTLLHPAHDERRRYACAPRTTAPSSLRT